MFSRFNRCVSGLQFPFSFSFGHDRGSRRVIHNRHLDMEQLEKKILLTSMLYVDFGDRFPGTGMVGTVGTLKTATSGVPGDPAVAGPNMDKDSNSDFAGAATDDPDPFTMSSFNGRYTIDGGNYSGGVTQLRADIMSFVSRFYQPFDITVVELTASSINVNGRMVQAAASLQEISSTLGANEAGVVKNNDGYVLVSNMIVHRPAVDGGNIDISSVWGGYASVIDMPNSNNSDNTAVSFVGPGALGPGVNPGRWGNLIAHEAGHLFGLQHGLTTAPGGAVSPLIPTSEIMTYLGGNGFNFFSRYPMVRGNGNTMNNEDLMATSPPSPVGNRTPYDQWINTPSIGQNNTFHYITGTGANDIVTIARTGVNATVSVQAFSDATYTSALNVPGSGGASTTYSYTLSLDRAFVVDGGDRSDRFIIDGDLGVTITVRGMSGTDQLIVMGKGAATGTYTTGSSTVNGLDNNPDLRGSVVIGATTILFQEFESASSATVQDVGTLTFRTALSADDLTLSSPIAGQSQISGTSDGAPIVPFRFFNVGTLNVDAGFGDGGGASDLILVNSLLAAGLNNVNITTDGGGDVVTIGNLNALPGGLTYDGGAGSDRLVGANTVNTWTVNGTNSGTYEPGGVSFSAVEHLEGGNNVDTFNVVASGGTINLYGGGANDLFNLSSDGPAQNGNVSAISGVVNVDGGTGDNQMVIADVTGAGNTNVVITNTAITGIAPATINYSATGGSFSVPGLQNGIWLKGIDGSNDNFQIDSFLAQNTLQIDAGSGNDEITSDLGALGNMKLDGQSGSDRVTIQMIDAARRINARDSGIGDLDSLSLLGLPIADNMVIRITSVRRDVVDRVDFDSQTENLDVLSLGGGDVFNIAASSATVTHVETGDGDDFVQVIDTIGTQSMNIVTGSGTDRVRVLATDAITFTSVLTGDDADFVFVGSIATLNNGSLDRILGPLNLSGGGNLTGEDRLYINDRATLTGQIYEIDHDSVSSLSPRLFNDPIMHDGFEVLRLDGTDLRDEFVVYPSFSTRYVIDGNLPNREDIACADEGDFLNLMASPASGRTLHLSDPLTGSGSWTFSNGFQGVYFTSIEKFNHVERLAVGSDAYLHSVIDVFDAESRDFLFRITPYESTFTGGVRVATGDVTGDGIPDIIAAPGPGRAPEVRIYDGTSGAFVRSFMAYDSTLWDGVLVSTGHVSGDCGVDIITTPGPGRGQAEVRVWENQVSGFAMTDHFLPFGPNFYGGASTAIADFNGDGIGDIAVGTLHGRAHVAVFDGSVAGGGNRLARFLAFQPDFYGGVHLAVGNVIGSGVVDLIVSSGNNSWGSQYSSQVHIYDGMNLADTQNVYDAPDFAFTAFGAEAEYPRASTRIAVRDYDLDGAIDELFASQGPGGQSGEVRIFDPVTGLMVDSIFESDFLFDNGIFVG